MPATLYRFGYEDSVRVLAYLAFEKEIPIQHTGASMRFLCEQACIPKQNLRATVIVGGCTHILQSTLNA
jgi:hypothetical protein